jgi:GNAT superfamily N-acetyltransferase
MDTQAKPEVRLARAHPLNAEALARASERAFHTDELYGGPAKSGPPGYDSAEWQERIMRVAEYYRILVDGQTVGGMIVFRKGPRAYQLGRVFVDPDWQNQGIGTRAFELLWKEYPLAKVWTLDTPAWNVRTRHFYGKLGFVELRETPDGGVLFERRS